MPRGGGRLVNRALRDVANALDNTKDVDTQTYNNSSDDERGPRSFPHAVKVACWEKADKIPGRDPDRWRRDAAGNVVFRKLTSCSGCLCHDYDHIQPYSKGGQSNLENCQVLQTAVNRAKGNRAPVTRTEMQQSSNFCRLSKRDMDTIELTTYGNVNHKDEEGQGCRIS